MAAQFVTHDEFDSALDNLKAYIGDSIMHQTEFTRAQMRVDKRELGERMAAIEAKQDALQAEVAEIKLNQTEMGRVLTLLVTTLNSFGQEVRHRLSTLEQQMAELRQIVGTQGQQIAAQGQQIAAQGQQIATLGQQLAEMREQIQDGFAAQAERHNELMQRVMRLEQRPDA